MWQPFRRVLVLINDMFSDTKTRGEDSLQFNVVITIKKSYYFFPSTCNGLYNDATN